MNREDCLRTKVLPQFNCSNCDHFRFEDEEILNSVITGAYAIECTKLVHPLEDCILRGFEGHSAQPELSQTLNKEKDEKLVIVVHCSYDKNQYFFSTDHCQPHNLGKSFVPCTHRLPMLVTPRESLPDGVIRNAQDLVTVFYSELEEIPNPALKYILNLKK